MTHSFQLWKNPTIEDDEILNKKQMKNMKNNKKKYFTYGNKMNKMFLLM